MTGGSRPYEFEHQSLQDPRSIVEYLEALARGFAAGRVLFVSGKNELVLKPGPLLDFSLRARRRDGQVRLSLKITWKEGETRGPSQAPLFIRAGDAREEDDD